MHMYDLHLDLYTHASISNVSEIADAHCRSVTVMWICEYMGPTYRKVHRYNHVIGMYG